MGSYQHQSESCSAKMVPGWIGEDWGRGEAIRAQETRGGSDRPDAGGLWGGAPGSLESRDWTGAWWGRGGLREVWGGGSAGPGSGMPPAPLAVCREAWALGGVAKRRW